MKARIKATGQLLYSSEDNDLFNDKRFRQMLKDEEVEILKDAAP